MRGLVGPLLKGLAFVLVTTVATVLLAVFHLERRSGATRRLQRQVHRRHLAQRR